MRNPRRMISRVQTTRKTALTAILRIQKVIKAQEVKRSSIQRLT